MSRTRIRHRPTVVKFRGRRANRARRSPRASYRLIRGPLAVLRNTYGLLALVAVVGAYGWSVQSGGATVQPPAWRSDGGVIVGRASVVDGDTIVIRDQRIRLHGIDAPESGQMCRDAMAQPYACGQRTTFNLDRKIGGQTVSCTPRGRDRYGRTIATCHHNGEDVNGWLVSQGWAVAYTRYSSVYLARQIYARLNGKGLWSGSFESPEAVRHRR